MTAPLPIVVGVNVSALLTAYHPDERLLAVVESALVSCARVIVADNTPSGSVSLAGKLDDPRVTVLSIGCNLGLGGALNLAARELPADTEAVLLMDQDSVLPAGLVEGLAAHLADPTIGIAAPTPWDAVHETHHNTFAGLHAQVSDRRAVITSGMLVRRTFIDQFPFREDLFNDFVDIAFCVKVRETGARIVQDLSLQLPHSMGDRREHKFGPFTVLVTHYPAFRHYWIARNGLVLNWDNIRRHPLSHGSTIIFLARKLTATALYEPQRRTHFPALVRGIRDGLLRRVSRQYLPAGTRYAGVIDGVVDPKRSDGADIQ